MQTLHMVFCIRYPLILPLLPSLLRAARLCTAAASSISLLPSACQRIMRQQGFELEICQLGSRHGVHMYCIASHLLVAGSCASTRMLYQVLLFNHDLFGGIW